MGHILHGSAKTTHVVRAAQYSDRKLRSRSSPRSTTSNPKTVMKWRHRQSVEDMPMGPQNARSTVLSAEEEALCVAFRRHTLLPLDDCLYALAGEHSTPHSVITTSPVPAPRYLASAERRGREVQEEVQELSDRLLPHRHGHIDMAEVRTAAGTLYMFVTIDRASKFAFVELHDKATRRNASDFLRRLIKAVPYKVHTLLTDNRVQFATPGNIASAAKDIREALDRGELVWAHGFELACARTTTIIV